MMQIPLKVKESIQDNALKSFLKQSFKTLNREFETYLEYIDKPEDLFQAGERTLLGLYSNAIVRSSNVYQTYQEFGVSDKEKEQYIGRADMFVMIPEFQILVEAKKWESATLEFSNRKLSNLLKEVWGQGLDYYNSEIKNFKENHI